MKQLVAIIFTLALPFCVNANDIKVINLSYSPSEFSIKDKNGVISIHPNTHSFILKSDIMDPALPYIGINILIDNNADYLSHKITSHEVLISDNNVLSQNPLPVPTNSSLVQSGENENEIIYRQNEYPAENVEYSGSHIIGGNKILCFSVCPFRYDVSRRQLFLKTQISLNISLLKTNKEAHSIQNQELVRDIVYNKEDLKPQERLLNKSLSGELPYEYLIVTRDSLKKTFQSLADWKTLKGVPTKVITVDSIYANSTEVRPQLQIKKALMDYYEDSNHALKYVLLAGDNEIVPAENCRVTNTFFRDDMLVTESHNVPADIFYSSFKTLDWDRNGNGFSGETTDNVDISHDIITTRLSACSVIDAQNQVNRILDYERNPKVSDWEDNILMCGTTLNEAHYHYPEGLMSDTHYKTEKVYEKYVQNNWTTAQKYMFYDTGTSFDGGDLYHFRVENLQEQFSRGYLFVYLVAHGEPDFWKMEWRNDLTPHLQLYYTSNALSVYNPHKSIIVTSACHTNGFSELPTCLSEGFMRNPNAGIIGYYGSSHYGWCYNDSINENPSDSFNGKMVERLLKSRKHQIGRAVYESKSAFLNNCSSNNSLRWLLFSQNALCDPEMPVYLSDPQSFGNVSITFSNNTLNVATGVSGCRICVMSKNDGGVNYYEVVDSTNNESFSIGSDTYSICITKTGYIPYVAIVGNPVYIQNENISSDILINSNQTLIGYDVTTAKAPGDVLVSKGKTTIINNGSVTITKGFEVKDGATFEIINSQ